MVSKRTLAVGIALAVVVAYSLTRWKGSAEPTVQDEGAPSTRTNQVEPN